ncbi:MAG: SEC-C metal-binding domain-containing protein [Candidatus Nealsonbacteria bacterium]|nr:SEC-C metal-binding domain-containing protein [Candidatus Nealsonbacteria bacterium]
MELNPLKINRSPILKSSGLNKSEEYLTKLCNKTFLSLWSYPNLYRAKEKELSDLLVVFGNHILIFSDKVCKYPESTDDKLNWNRWFRRAVEKSAKQLWRAEQWIRQRPESVFLDKECERPFPFDIDTHEAKIHLILIAHGTSDACKKYFGSGSGSLMIQNDIKGITRHTTPFVIGDINPLKTFVHVLDDATLDIVMGTLDTISDLVSYFSKKEILLRSDKGISATGEEDLLPSYLTKIKDGVHDFDFPTDLDGIAIVEGAWDYFCNNPQRKAQLNEDRISYFWDELIERFNLHALNGTQYTVSAGGLKDSEKILRFFAGESRFHRRVLSKAVLGLIEKTPDNICGRRFIIPLNDEDPYYVLIVFPQEAGVTREEYRLRRGEYLTACCMIVRAVYPRAKDIVGFSTESGKELQERSEDAIYLNGRHWNEKMQKEAEELRVKLQILVNSNFYKMDDKEFPDVVRKYIPRVGRNDKCPCDSGKKYKKCHGLNY